MSLFFSCSLVLVMCLGYKLCRFEGGEGMWSISCALAVSTGLVSRNSCFSIKFLLTAFVRFALAFLSLTKDWVRQSSMQAKSLTALVHLKKNKK